MGIENLSLDSLNVSQLHEQVYALLKEEILKGSFVPGQRLSINVISKSLGISVTPVRDALQHLDADGLVDIIPRRGTFVSDLSQKAVKEIFQIRRILECASADKLAEAPQQVIENIQAVANEESLLREGDQFRDYLRHIDLDEKLHQLIVGLLNNARLSEIHDELRWPLQVTRGLLSTNYRRAARVVAEHAAIVQAFVERDEPKAKRAILAHLESAEAYLLNHIEK
jgi:DNA-binding GntR family transcriptional regulator